MAKALEYIFIDSGAMYRCVTLFALTNKIIQDDSIDIPELIRSLPHIHISFDQPNAAGEQAVYLNGKNVSDAIRSLEVAGKVSEIASIKEIRAFLVKQQQQLGATGGVIMDGRDIGSVVFPDAELKLFITASKEIRAQRRFKELTEKGEHITLEEVVSNLEHRDYLDTTRKESPLIQTADAIVIDNSHLTIDEQLQLALNYAQQATKKSTKFFD